MGSKRTPAFFFTTALPQKARPYSPKRTLAPRQALLPKPAVLHRTIQYGFLAFFIFAGMQFYFYYLWASGQSNFFVAKPPSVEAFLPLSAMLALKRLLLTGQYDFTHPAGLTILLMALGMALVLRKSFCGYLCPVGAVSMLLFRLGRWLGISRRPGKMLSFLLGLPKYALLYFVFAYILQGLTVDEIEAFLRTPYNMVADSKMLLFFLNMSLTTAVFIVVMGIGSMLIPGFWCNGFCPYGALLGLLAVFSPVAVFRNKEACLDCGRCTRACPSHIPVQDKKRVSGPDCVGCTECVSVCPAKNCLMVRLGYTKRAINLPDWFIPATTLGVLATVFTLAKMHGYWDSQVPAEVLRHFHGQIMSIGHP